MSARGLPLIVLRPEPGCAATVARAAALGLDAHGCPLFAIEARGWTPPPADAFSALLLTSANAVRHGGAALHRYRSLPVWAVGEATAEAAREAGFTIAATGDAGAQALVERMRGQADQILWLCGEQRSAIAAPVATITALPVYAARRIEPAPQLAALLAEPAVAMVHSARAGKALGELVGERAALSIAAIGAPPAVPAGARSRSPRGPTTRRCWNWRRRCAKSRRARPSRG